MVRPLHVLAPCSFVALTQNVIWQAGLAPPTPLAEEQSLLFFHTDERVQPALVTQLALDAEKRLIDWKIVGGSCRGPE